MVAKNVKKNARTKKTGFGKSKKQNTTITGTKNISVIWKGVVNNECNI